MTSKEIVRGVIRHKATPRIAWDFLDPRYQDMQFVSPIHLINHEAEKYTGFGYYEDLMRRANFHGEVHMDSYGNIIGRLNGITKGECVLGALESGWDALERYDFPAIDQAHVEKTRALNLQKSEQYVMAYLPAAVFSTLRDLRKMDNALMDTVEEPEMLEAYMEKLTPFIVEMVKLCADCHVDGVMICDDWGMQFSPFISPAAFRKIFKPVYKAVTDACHERDIDFLLHSCGFVLPLVDDMIDAGIDVFQFDQPEAAGSPLWAEKYSSRAAFYCPVDIQKVMPTGDRELIEKTALDMVNIFKKHGGALIAKDYPSWGDIGVKDEWAKWARDVLIANSDM